MCYELLGNSQDPKIPCFLAVSVPVTHWAVKVRFGADDNGIFQEKYITPTKQPMRIFHQLGNRHTLRFDPRMAFGISMVKDTILVICVCHPSCHLHSKRLTPNLRQPATNASKNVFI